MKQLSTPLTLLCVVLFMSSFKPEGYRDLFKETGSIEATLNGRRFEVREGSFYRAMLVTKASSFTNSQSGQQRTATSLFFYGKDSTDEKGSAFTEGINIEFTFNPSGPGEVSNLAIDVSYALNDFYMLPEGNSFRVTKMDWNAEKNAFSLSGKFECLLRKRGYSADWQQEVRMKGEVNDIHVTVPPWIASKLNTQASLGQ